MKIIYLLLIGLLASCGSSESEDANMIKYPIEIKLNETGTSFDQRLKSKYSKVNKQPAGLTFHELDFPLKEPAKVKFLHGNYSFEIPSVMTIVGTENLDFIDRGISHYNIIAGISDASLIDHDEARIKLYQMFEGLLDKGWVAIYDYSEPRIFGKESYTYMPIKKISVADPGYMPSMDIWMSMRSGFWWAFYADGVFMDIRLNRDSSRKDPDKPGAYIFSLTINDLETQAKIYMDFKEREIWRTVWVDKIKVLKRIRYQKEAELAAQGFNIDTSYEDPIMHPADPVEP